MATEIPPPPRGVYQWRSPFRLTNVIGALLWRWNEPMQAWSISIADQSGNTLAGPIPLATGKDLFAQWRHFDVPPGTLTVESAQSVPGVYDFGSSARLMYTPTV